MWGTLVNTGAVLLGSLIGLVIKFAVSYAARRNEAAPDPLGEEKRPSRFSYLPSAVQNGLGLCAIVIGLLGTFDFESGYKLNILVAILSVVLGAVVGELLDLDGLLNRFGNFIEKKMKGRGGRVAEGFVSATLLFCVGAMTVSGAIESGMEHQHNTYYAKSMLDLVSSVIFASTMGIGVLFSAVAVFGIQGALTGVAVLAGGAIPADVTAEMIGVGSLLIMAIGTNLLGMTKIKVMNFLPAMFFPIALLPLYNLVF
ncbi:MAG: DUF554 domain-containing protein [Clostridia bacterium]|nr:DUF554 domain-containing protein [Clostridia bacterium]